MQTQFTLSTQETKDFYNALLRPVDLYILKFFIRQGYSRELLFWLFMDSVDVTVAKHTIGFQFNPPYDYGCPQEDPRKRCFREWTEMATITGLSVDEHTEGAGGGAAAAVAAAPPRARPRAVVVVVAVAAAGERPFPGSVSTTSWRSGEKAPWTGEPGRLRLS